MVDLTTPPSTRVRAAEAALSHAEKAIEIEDIDARLKELEAGIDVDSQRIAASMAALTYGDHQNLLTAVGAIRSSCGAFG